MHCGLRYSSELAGNVSTGSPVQHYGISAAFQSYEQGFDPGCQSSPAWCSWVIVLCRTLARLKMDGTGDELWYLCTGVAYEATGSKITCLHAFMLSGILDMPLFQVSGLQQTSFKPKCTPSQSRKAERWFMEFARI